MSNPDVRNPQNPDFFPRLRSNPESSSNLKFPKTTEEALDVLLMIFLENSKELNFEYLLKAFEFLVDDFSVLVKECSVFSGSLSDHDISSGGGRLIEVMEFKEKVSMVGAFSGFLTRLMAVFEIFYLKGTRRKHGLTKRLLTSQELQAEYLANIDQTACVFFDFLKKMNSSKLLPDDNDLFEQCSNRLFCPTPERGTIIFGRHISCEKTFSGLDILLENSPNQISQDLDQLRSLLEIGEISQEVFLESLAVFLGRILADYMAAQMAVCKIGKNISSTKKVSTNITLRKINLFLDSFARNGKIENIHFRAFAGLENKIDSHDEFTAFHANSLPELALLLQLIFDIVKDAKKSKDA